MQQKRWRLGVALVYACATWCAHAADEELGRYGFRTDPMAWLVGNNSLEAAQVRVLVLKRGEKGDREILDEAIGDILATQQKDGSFASPEEVESLSGYAASQALRLFELGMDPGRPEIRQAAEFMVKGGLIHEGDPDLEPTAVACRAGLGNHAEVQAALDFIIKWVPAEVIGRMCPWAETISLRPLWAGQGVAATGPVIEEVLAWANRALNDAGAISYKDTGAFIQFAGYSDHPLARQLLVRLVPLILRLQKEDGSFGGNTVGVFRALQNHGLLERLRTLPPLPRDWNIVREIPVPAEGLSSMAWDGSNLWALDSDVLAPRWHHARGGRGGGLSRPAQGQRRGAQRPGGPGRTTGCHDDLGAADLAPGGKGRR